MIQSLIPSPVRGLKILNSNTLTEEQTNVLRAILRGQSLFFTGSAGTGKSYLLKFIISRLPPETTFVTASTGIAACNINGITLHMFSGIPSTWLETSQDRKLTAPEIASRLMKNEAKAQRWRNCKCLIVDEVSMVGGDYFEMMDQVARIIRRNEKPFGGIQVVLCGDFLQLPPITKKGNFFRFRLLHYSLIDFITPQRRKSFMHFKQKPGLNWSNSILNSDKSNDKVIPNSSKYYSF